MHKLSVIMPCLNEEQGVGICINKIYRVFEDFNIDGEIIVIDNGSSDNTANIARSMNAFVVYEPLKGYGNAYRSGFKVVNGDIIVMGDADNSYDFNEIPKLLQEIEKADFVIGNRVHLKKGSIPYIHSKIGKPLFSFLLKNLFNLPISDSHCGFGAIKKDSLNRLKLKSSGMEFASEILIKAKKNNLVIREIPITYYPRIGKSKLRTFRDGARHLFLIFREYFSDLK